MTKASILVRQFLDIEAEVDTEERDENEEDDEDDEFIVDEVILDEESVMSHGERTIGLEDRDAELHNLIEEFYQNAMNRTGSTHGTNFNSFRQENTCLNWEWNSLDSVDNYPLWRVGCRIGREEFAVTSLLKTARDHHQLRSAFTRGALRGAVYLECRMNNHLLNLLTRTLGIIQTAQGPQCCLIDASDYGNLLRMADPNRDFEVGDWVRVKSGLYNGDIGLLTAKETWGLSLLLVPRLSTTVNRKRKKGNPRPEPDLFQYVKFRCFYPDSSCQEDRYHINHATFSYGFLHKDFDYYSIEKPVTAMPWRLFEIFRASAHPTVMDTCLPQPQEWSFEEEDKVLNPMSATDQDKYAVIKAIEPLFVMVDTREFEDRETMFCLSWHRVLKYFEVGDCVLVTSGPFQGDVGCVIQRSHTSVFILRQVNDQEDEYNPTVTNGFEIHPNCITLHQEQLEGGDTISKRDTVAAKPAHHEKLDRHPWLGLDLTVARVRNPWKGHRGIVKDVLPLVSKKNGDAMNLVLQLLRYDPAAPFREITVELRDVVLSSSQQRLSDYIEPKSLISMPIPSDLFQGPMLENGDFSGSRTPRGDLEPIDQLTADELHLVLHGSLSQSPAHQLLNNRLVNLTFVAVVNGGGFSNKEMPVSILMTENIISFSHQRYKARIPLQADWIIPKHPNLTHDNGLLVVIEGEHLGKYARRIHHRNSLLMLAVVTKIHGGNTPDTLTGETIYVPPESVCIVWETKKEKGANKELMKQLRDNYHATFI